jgi:ABC-type nickel/cobalt efflux system permease component RcnA
VGAVALGAVHGIEPGHGWPVAASYALDQPNKWLYGLAASLVLGVGHLVSSIAMVAAFFWAKSYFSLTQVNEPIALAPGVAIGGPVSLVAGVLLILLGVREYRHGHSHSHGADGERSHSHSHDDPARDASAFDHPDGGHGERVHDHGTDGQAHDHGPQNHDHHDHSHEQGPHDHEHGNGHERDAGGGLLAGIRTAVPFLGGHSHVHADESMEDAADRGLWGIAGFAFVLGFAHEEEFEIIALCAGSQYCLELMTAYALTVVAGIVTLTLLLIAGYENFEAEVEQYTPYLPAFSATVLILMGVGFVAGVF